MKKLTNFKYMDEYGECYLHETIECTVRGRNDVIRKFINREPYVRTYKEDVMIIQKTNGEELWVYED